MARTLVLLLAITLGLATFFAQGQSRSPRREVDDGLVLRGQVDGIRTEIPAERHAAVVTVDLTLEFSNSGPQPVILLTERAPLCVGTIITKTPAPATDENLLYADSEGPSVDGSPEWAILRKALDQAQPPPDKVRILAPAESWTTKSFVVLRPPIADQGHVPARPAAPLGALEKQSPVWLRLYCVTWPRNLEARPQEGKIRTARKFKRQWQSFGLLRLSPITSEPIRLDLSHEQLPDAPAKGKGDSP